MTGSSFGITDCCGSLVKLKNTVKSLYSSMMREFLDSEISALSRKFRAAKPFPHLVIENFLANHKLLMALENEKFYRKDSDLFSFSQSNNLFYSKSPVVSAAVKMFSSQQFAALIGKISGIKLKAGAVDVSASLYEKTDYLLCHDDQLEGRKIAFISYLSKSFAAADGGALVFLSNKVGNSRPALPLRQSKGSHPDKKVVAYPPLQNSLMIFAVSKKSWHEVEEVLADRKRYTIGGWLH